MALSPAQLRRELREAGIANAAIDAAWPQWWSDEAAGSLSATTELTFTVARRLGLSPQALFEGSTRFLWRDDTKFKRLDTRTPGEDAALASFGIVIARSAVAATVGDTLPVRISAGELRTQILEQGRTVDFPTLISFCWAFGIPVIQLHVFPLDRKRMHAMTVRVKNRYAILLGYRSRYHAQTAYILAHEIGHILLGHLADSDALLEEDDPLMSGSTDEEEIAADRFALAVLTGTESPRVLADTSSYSATQLAAAAVEASEQERVDPGVLALCLGHSTKQWDKSFGALKVLPPGAQDLPKQINDLASSQFDWNAISTSSREYLARVMGLSE